MDRQGRLAQKQQALGRGEKHNKNNRRKNRKRTGKNREKKEKTGKQQENNGNQTGKQQVNNRWKTATSQGFSRFYKFQWLFGAALKRSCFLPVFFLFRFPVFFLLFFVFAFPSALGHVLFLRFPVRFPRRGPVWTRGPEIECPVLLQECFADTSRNIGKTRVGEMWQHIRQGMATRRKQRQHKKTFSRNSERNMKKNRK